MNAPPHLRPTRDARSQWRRQLRKASAEFLDLVGKHSGLFAADDDFYHVLVNGRRISRSKLNGWRNRGWLRRVGSNDRGVAYQRTEEAPS